MIARIRAWWKRRQWERARRQIHSYECEALYGWRRAWEHQARFNGGIRCDMDVGPCACGAWHEWHE